MSLFCQRKSSKIIEHLVELIHLLAFHRNLSMRNRINQGCNLDVKLVKGLQTKIEVDEKYYHQPILNLFWLSIRVDHHLPSR